MRSGQCSTASQVPMPMRCSASAMPPSGSARRRTRSASGRTRMSRIGADPSRSPAAMAALYLSLSYRMSIGNDAAARGWLGRAARLVKDHQLDDLRGWVLLCSADIAIDTAIQRQPRRRRARRPTWRTRPTTSTSSCVRWPSSAPRSWSRTEATRESRCWTRRWPVRWQGRATTRCRRARQLPDDHCLQSRRRPGARDAVGPGGRRLLRSHGSPHLYTTCRTHYGGILFAPGDGKGGARADRCAAHRRHGRARAPCRGAGEAGRDARGPGQAGGGRTAC